MNLKEYVNSLTNDGFKISRARVKACQEIFMMKLFESRYKDSIVFKGGTILYQLTKEIRRSTEDIDIDLIKMSINDDHLVKVFNDIGQRDIGVNIYFFVDSSKIEELHHEEYEGKRLVLQFKDEMANTLFLKLDIGVHTHHQIQQSKMMFDIIHTEKGIELLVNPIEQMIVEKTSSFIKRGILSTRTKDIFDIYYLISNQEYSTTLIRNLIQVYFVDTGHVSSMQEYIQRMLGVLESDIFIGNLLRSDNWLNIEVSSMMSQLKDFFVSLEKQKLTI